MNIRHTSPLLPWLLALFVSGGLYWSLASAGELPKPFAENRVVLQISDADPDKQTLVLNVAGNLIKHYGPDRVDIEVVAFGPGLRLLFAENTNTDRIAGLVDSAEVRFSACSNTIRGMAATLGHEPAINPQASKVSAGIVRILDLVNQGYTLVKP